MSVHTVLVHEAVGETRAAAIDDRGQVVGLFFDRWAEQATRLRWGQTVSGTVARCSPENGGIFITLEGGHEGFLSTRDRTGWVEGATSLYRVVAEARRGKLTKVAIADEPVSLSPFQLWQSSLPGAISKTDRSIEAAQTIDAAFEDALNPIAVLSGGGRLQITPTPALIAVDVDTVGRKDKGRASTRARAVNMDAAGELARQVAIRSLGGAIVLDCIAPLARRDGSEVKARFLETFRAISTRRAECLAPSPFGLMEAVLEHRVQPLHETCQNARGEDLPIAKLLAGLRQLEREAIANRSASLTLALPSGALAAYKTHETLYRDALVARFGARLKVSESPKDVIEVSVS